MNYRPTMKNADELHADEIAQFMKITDEEIHVMKKNENKPWFFSNWFWFRTVYQSDTSYFNMGYELYKK